MAVVALVLVLGLAAAMAWQHARYQRARRGPVQDRQAPFYPGSTFHVLTFVRLPPGQDATEALRKLRSDLEAGGSAKLVYAGRVALVGIASSQLPATAWDAVLLVQYPSRAAYEATAASAVHRSALASFAETFSHGFQRPAALNLAIPQLLLVLRAWQLLTRRPSHYPLRPAAPDERDARTADDDRLAALERLWPLGRDAVVVVNLLRHGTPEQQRADRRYGLAMAGLFAEGGHGPMHMGRSVTLEGDARFDRVALVYYPGIATMQSLMRSTFFNGIVGGKQPGDTLAVLTLPVLSLL